MNDGTYPFYLWVLATLDANELAERAANEAKIADGLTVQTALAEILESILTESAEPEVREAALAGEITPDDMEFENPEGEVISGKINYDFVAFTLLEYLEEDNEN